MTSARPKILVIDDEPDVLEMIRMHFGIRGFEVFTASDGSEGIELCRSIQPDLILLDLKMKQVDGDTALPDLRRLAPTAPIFVISAYQDEVTENRIRGLGVTAWFEKPVSILELEKAVRQRLQ